MKLCGNTQWRRVTKKGGADLFGGGPGIVPKVLFIYF